MDYDTVQTDSTTSGNAARCEYSEFMALDELLGQGDGAGRTQLDE